jgi:hypothetical protein
MYVVFRENVIAVQIQLIHELVRIQLIKITLITFNK